MTAYLRADRMALQQHLAAFFISGRTYGSRDVRRAVRHVYGRLVYACSAQHCTGGWFRCVVSVDHAVQSKDGPKSGPGRLNCVVYLVEI